MSEHVTSLGDAVHAVQVEAAHAIEKRPRLAAAWSAARPLAKAALYGAAFVGGGLLIAKLFGPSTVKQLGHQGGESFAQGVNEVQTQIARATRGLRFG